MLTHAQYAFERAICDKAQAYAKQIMRDEKRGHITSEEALHTDYAACNNAMRGRVEQYELLTKTPEVFGAYLSMRDGKLCVTTWTGDFLGYATRGKSWRVNGSHRGTHMVQYYANIVGREYTGRGFGEGMCIVLRETADSKRSRAALNVPVV